MTTSFKNILDFLKRDFWLVFRNSLLLTSFYLFIIPVIRGISNLDNIQSAQCFSQSVAFVGIIILVPVIRHELEISIKEVICTKTWPYLRTVVVRLCCGFAIISVIIIGFALIMKNNNCTFSFWTYVFSSILYAGFMGVVGILFSQMGGSVILGYLVSLGYWSLCQLQIIAESNVLYLFPIVSGNFEIQKLITLILILAILIGGLVLSNNKN